MRVNESGVGLAGLAVNMNAAMAMNTSKFSDNRTLTTLTSDHNKYGPPPGEFKIQFLVCGFLI